MMLISRLIRHIRYLIWNTKTGISISKHTFIAPSVLIQLSSDGNSISGLLVIEDGVIVSDGAIIAPYGGSIHLERNVYIGPYCVLYGHGGLKVGENSMIATHSVLVPSSHNFTKTSKPINQQGSTNLGIIVGKDVWIGANVKVLDGVNIGNGSIVGAGAVVNMSIPENSIAVGVPARVIKQRGE